MAADKFPIEAGHIMMFARSVGDDNQIYHSEDYAKTTEVGHVIAPPTFAQASAQFDPNYFLRPKVGQAWFGSGKNPTGVVREPSSGGGGGGGGGLHAEQHYEYHRHLKVGDVLTATLKPGKTWERESPRAETAFGDHLGQPTSAPLPRNVMRLSGCFKPACLNHTSSDISRCE